MLPEKVAEEIARFKIQGLHLVIEKTNPVDSLCSVPLLMIEFDNFIISKQFYQTWDRI